MIVPAKPQVAHIGKDGLHGVGPQKLKLMEQGVHGLSPFHGTSFQSGMKKMVKAFNKGYGGWGHPADHEHCIKLFGAKPTSVNWRQTLGLA